MSFADIAKTFVRKDLPESEAELAGEVPFEELAPYRARALAHLSEHAELPGFRPGKVPPEMVLKKVGEPAVLEEAVELLISDLYPQLLMAQSIDAVGRPDVRITKLAEGNPVGLTIRVTLYPAVVLPKDWKKISEKVAIETPLPATQEEVDKTLEDVRQSRKVKKEDGTEEAPELNDEFAKSLGAFDNLAALREQVTKGITEEKARAAKDKRRGKIIDKLLAEATIPVPRIFVESEQEKIMAQMRDDVARFGMDFDEYLKKINKTEEGVRAEFREQAHKRAKLQLLLNKIAEEEKLEADPDAVEQEMKHALEHFPSANPELLGVHIQTVMKNEKALKLLEGEKSEG